MNKIACLFSILLLAFFAAGTEADVKNPDTFVLADYRTVQTIRERQNTASVFVRVKVLNSRQ
jgi:hypothetical protein